MRMVVTLDAEILTKSPDLDLMLKSKECRVSREAREHYKDTLPIHLSFCCELSVNLCKVMGSCQPILRLKNVKKSQKRSLR